jgi:hypothetical protein
VIGHAARVLHYPCLEYPELGSGKHWVFRYPRVRQRLLARCRRPARELLYLPAMSKSSKRSRRSHGTADRSATTDVVTQLECAIRNPHAAAIGAVIGGLIPWFGRTLAHDEIPSTWSGGNHGFALAMIAVVLGCACFSALSVYKFGRAAFGDPRKALGFVLALEGVMLVSHGATSAVALAVLIVINAVANGSVIALSRDATRRRCEADARRAATRARNRAAARGTEQPSSEPAEAPACPAPATTATEAPRARRSVRVPAHTPGHTPGLVLVPPVWRRATLDDVIDAEIVSEERLLA